MLRNLCHYLLLWGTNLTIFCKPLLTENQPKLWWLNMWQYWIVFLSQFRQLMVLLVQFHCLLLLFITMKYKAIVALRDPFNTPNLFRKKRWRRDEHITNKFWESKTLKVLICRAVMRDLNFIMLKSEMEMSDISYHQNNNIIVEILNCYHIENNWINLD